MSTLPETPAASARRFGADELAQRERAVLDRLAMRDLVALIVTGPENIYYLTGFSTPAYYAVQALVITRDREPVILVYDSERENVLVAPRVTDVVTYGPGEDPMSALAALLRDRGLDRGRVGIETSSWFLPPALHRRLRAQLDGEGPVACDGTVEACRAVKSEAEIDCIREAAELASRAMCEVRDLLRPGVRENEIAATIYASTLSGGGEYPGSPPYVSTGKRVCQGHATWSRRAIEAGDQVYVELSACVSRYSAALMRTFSLDEPMHSELCRLEVAIKQGLDAVIAALRPGVPSTVADAACREVVAAHGFDYPHETGYSIGISYPPGWNETHVFNLKPGDERPVERNMVLHLVPHTIIEGVGTVGLSETVLVGAEGAQPLTSFPREVVRL